MNQEHKPEELPEQEALVTAGTCTEEQVVPVDETEAESETVAESVIEADEELTSGPADGAMAPEDLNVVIEQLCVSKADEFHQLGYDQITGLDIWNCVSSKYKELPPMHKLVNDILSLRTNKFMNWLLIKAQTE